MSEIQDTIRLIQKAIHNAEKGNGLPLVVSEIRLELQAKTVRTAGGELTLKIFGLELGTGAGLEETSLHNLMFQLEPPRAAAFGAELAQENIEDLIAEVREVALQLQGIQGFGLTKTSITIEFSVTSEGKISIGAKLGGKLGRGQKLTLTMIPR